MSTLKKIISLLLCMAMLVSVLASCNGNDSGAQETSEPTTEQTEGSGDNTNTDTQPPENEGGADEPQPHTHTPAAAVTENYVDSTCAKAGSYDEVVYCSECQEEISREQKEIAKKEVHTPVTDPRVEPTFTSTGLTEGSHCSVCEKVLIAQDVIPMLPSKTTLTTTVLSLDGRSISGSFSYSTEVFSFVNEIVVTNNSPWVVSTDSYGMQTVATKTVPLSEGNNTFYIHVTNPDQTVSTYTVNIYRNHLYTVRFNTNGGASVPTQYVEEGYLAEQPTTARTGYTFASWDYDFSTPIRSNMTINATWTANGNTPYNVEYYLQNVDQNGYDLVETESLTGETDTTAYAEQKTFEHFTLNTYQSTLSGNINGDGGLVLKVYYTRDTYSVSTDKNNTKGGTITWGGNYAYGKEITLTATTNAGYTFLGWYSGEELLSEDTEYTTVIDRNIVAKFDVAPEMQNFIFTSTATTCTISGIKDNTVTEIVVPDYVTAINKGAFNGCDLLESITLPWVVTSLSSLFDKVVPAKLEHVIITRGDIPSFSLDYISSMKTLTLGEGVTNIQISNGPGGSNFSGCYNLTEFIVDDNNKAYKTDDGVLYSKNGETLMCYPPAKPGHIFVIPDGVTKIGCNAFTEVNDIRSVIVSDSVTLMGSYAFEHCSNLVSITLGRNVSDIRYAFFGTDPIEVINKSYLDTETISSELRYALEIHSGNSKIELYDQYIFYTHNDINYLVKYVGTETNIVLPENYNGKEYQIYYSAFDNCDNLTSIEISDSVTSIGDHAFYYCDRLTSVVIGDSVTSIGNWAFSGCDSLASIKYRGTQAQWNAITKGSGWDSYTDNCTITYNYQGE